MNYIQQYKKMEDARKQYGLYSAEHNRQLDCLYNLFFDMQYGDCMGICSKKCKKTMIWKNVDKGWAAVCDCSESFYIKTEFT